MLYFGRESLRGELRDDVIHFNAERTLRSIGHRLAECSADRAQRRSA